MELKLRLDSLGLMENLESMTYCLQLCWNNGSLRLSTALGAPVDRHSCPEACLAGLFASIDRDLSGCRQALLS
ncbi:hypothetical protein Taro_038131 [Colocasia esculenta]|uniref:Uncharacterized protein n=1 Tax=Colocasia esculenta TaxID=4460 RepID=A0A843W2J8_COLES|nr:hypothetical protein [Colocasia esculenta]